MSNLKLKHIFFLILIFLVSLVIGCCIGHNLSLKAPSIVNKLPWAFLWFLMFGWPIALVAWLLSSPETLYSYFIKKHNIQ